MGISDDLTFRIEISPETVHFGLQICDIRKFCFALRQMTEMPYFRPHSLTVAAPSHPHPPPLPVCNVDLGHVLIARKLFVTQKLIQNLHCCFPGHKQFPGNQSAQVPSQPCIGGRGRGGGGFGGSSDCQGMWLEIRHFSHLS